MNNETFNEVPPPFTLEGMDILERICLLDSFKGVERQLEEKQIYKLIGELEEEQFKSDGSRLLECMKIRNTIKITPKK